VRRILTLAAAVTLAGCGARTGSLPVYGSVPEFTLTAQTGGPFSSGSLSGDVWVASFMFTSCLGPCPRMSSQMRWLGRQLQNEPRIRFVSFTVDPARDTPTALAAYAKRYQADPARWVFLTGPQPVLQRLDRDVFKLGDVDGSLIHSTRFVLVDGRGRIRGYYATDEEKGLEPLLADVRRLAKEAS